MQATRMQCEGAICDPERKRKARGGDVFGEYLP